MKVRGYIKNIILGVMDAEGSYARDLVEEVSERVGEPFSIQRVGSYLRVMFASGEVRREAEIEEGCLRRYKWFRNDSGGV